MRETKRCYITRCKDCHLFESYQSRPRAKQHWRAHEQATDHDATVKEMMAYA